MWNCEGGKIQTAYRIAAESEGKTLWDSGKVKSDDMRAEYPSEPVSRMRAEWKVMLWDENDKPGEWSEKAYFETGLLKASDWKADWIAGSYRVRRSRRYPVDCFRKTFTAKKVCKARLYATACGLYEVCINGKKAGNFVLAPGHTDYCKRIQYQTYDVTELINEGCNTLTAQLADGWYTATEIKAAKGYLLDSTPHNFEVKAGRTTSLTVENTQAGSMLIHKIDSVTGKGIYGVTFLVSDSKGNPIGQYTSDQNGYVYIDKTLTDGKYLVREIQAADGYVLDTTVKTFYVEYGGTSTITWKNTPITGQIQIVKKSADYNPTNGLPAGTLLEGAVFEITDKAGNVVDTIRSNSRGLAVSKQLPLSRYFVREIKAPDHYGINDKELTAYLEYEGQILRFEVENKSLSTGVSITKTGPKEIVAGQPVRYAFSGIANTSNVSLSSFYWRDTLPAQVRLDTVVTGTYNRPGTYKIVYRVNGGDHRTLADNLSTQKNYTLAASATALKLASNERVTEIMFVFGQAPAGFAQVEKPYLHCKAVTGLSAGSFVNVADVGGTYGGTWVQGISRWVTTVYGKPVIPTLPKTGY